VHRWRASGAPVPFPNRQLAKIEESSFIMENLSVAEAATLAGVGKSTIRRAIKRGELLATTVEGPNGEQFSVSVSSFEAWMASRGGAPQVHQTVEPGAAPSGALVVHQGEQAWDAVVESQQTVQKALEALERAQAENIKMVRQVAHLEGKMESQKLLLSANSETVQKKEQKLEELRTVKDEELKKLEQSNAEQMARFEKEREEMLERLKMAESIVQKYEKVPSWVKKMFGT
jgi:excisionase family DNA binding protein